MRNAFLDAVDFFLIRIRKGRVEVVMDEDDDSDLDDNSDGGGDDAAGNENRNLFGSGSGCSGVGPDDDGIRVDDVNSDDDDDDVEGTGTGTGNANARIPSVKKARRRERRAARRRSTAGPVYDYWEECSGYNAGSNHSELRWKSDSFLAGLLLLCTASWYSQVSWFIFLAVTVAIPWGLSLFERCTGNVADRSGLKKLRLLFILVNKLAVFYFAWQSYIQIALVAAIFFKDLSLAIVMLR